MSNSKTFASSFSNVVLISIHPQFVDAIVSGTKNVEFRRRWSNAEVDALLVYATAPRQSLAALVQVKSVIQTGKEALWEMCQRHGGGLTRAELREYFGGLDRGVALTLGQRYVFSKGLLPGVVFGKNFRPPQSFRYLTITEMAKVQHAIDK